MKELLETIVRALVDQPERVVVLVKSEEDGLITLELKVDAEDMGRVIGRNGRTAKAIRSLMKAYAVKIGKRVNVEIVE